jgi:hypothetical protein
MICFRVSDHEFAALKTECEARGARSISEFARLTLCGWLAGANGNGQGNGHSPFGPGPSGTLERPDPGLHRLTDEIQQLKNEIGRVTAWLEREGIKETV